MSLFVELSERQTAALADEARQQGLTLSEYAARLLGAGRETRPALRTGADLVAYWKSEGLAGSRADIGDASARARALREVAESRKGSEDP